MFEIYQEKPSQKKFALQFEQDKDKIYINAVDRETGEFICLAAWFENSGFWVVINFKKNMEKDGYDISGIPFDSRGAIKLANPE